VKCCAQSYLVLGHRDFFRLIESIPITSVPQFEIQLRSRKAVVRRLFSGISKGVDDVLCLLASPYLSLRCRGIACASKASGDAFTE